MNPIEIALDKSNAWRGPYFEQAGKPVSLESAIEQGFFVTREDAPAVLTLIQNFIMSRELTQK